MQVQNRILQSLIAESSPSGQQPPFKFTVTSTIIEQVSGKRGMHSATGAFWNNERDGMWSHKYEESSKGFDTIISITWISIA